MARRVYRKDGRFDVAAMNDDEICIILTDAERTALIKILGRQSRETRAMMELTEADAKQADMVWYELSM